jgi:hypothetical protein
MSPLQAHAGAPAGMKPNHVPFTPYQSYQVSRVLHQRLALLPGPCFDRRAVEMCARKVSRRAGRGAEQLGALGSQRSAITRSSEAREASPLCHCIAAPASTDACEELPGPLPAICRCRWATATATCGWRSRPAPRPSPGW